MTEPLSFATLGNVSEIHEQNKKMKGLRLLSLIGAVLLILYIIYRLTLVWMVNDKRDELRQQGYIVDKDIFLSRLPQIPDEENAAVGIVKVFPKFDTSSADAKDVMGLKWQIIEEKQSRPKKNKKGVLIPHSKSAYFITNQVVLSNTNIHQSLSTDLLGKMDIYVQKHEPYLKDVFQSLSLKKSFYPLDYTNGLLYSISVKNTMEARKIVYILRAYSIYYAETGRQDKAFDYLMASISMTETFHAEPFLINHLIKISLCNIFHISLERNISKIQFNKNQLYEIQKQLQKIKLPDLNKSFEVELLSSLDILDSIDISKEFGLQESISQFSDPNNLIDIDRYGDTLKKFLQQYTYAIAGIQSIEKLYLMNLYENLIRIEDFKYTEKLRQYEKFTLRTDQTPSLFFVSKSTLFPVVRTLNRQTMTQAKNQTAITAIAIERYRLKYGRLPDSLEQIAPEFIETIPLDPFTEKPLLYQKTQKGYVVYSVGIDLTDNGGKKTNSADKEYEDGSDIVFEVVR